MIRKNNRTLEMYKNAGAKMRLFKELGTKLMVDLSPLLSAKDNDKLHKIMNEVSGICSHAEDNMFSDFPELSNEYIDVFYGTTSMQPRNDVDKEIINLAKTLPDELFL